MNLIMSTVILFFLDHYITHYTIASTIDYLDASTELSLACQPHFQSCKTMLNFDL